MSKNHFKKQIIKTLKVIYEESKKSSCIGRTAMFGLGKREIAFVKELNREGYFIEFDVQRSGSKYELIFIPSDKAAYHE